MYNPFDYELDKADSPEEMRAAIFKLTRDDHMTREIMDVADYSGMSAEDRYTTLTYYALEVKISQQKMLVEQLNNNPSTPIVMKESDISQDVGTKINSVVQAELTKQLLPGGLLHRGDTDDKS